MPIPTFSRQRLRPSRDRPEEARELSREGSQCGARAGEGAHDAGLSCGARAAEAGRGGQPGRDLPSLQGFHIEAKITQACKMFSPATLAQWDAQAQRDSEGRSVPLVILPVEPSDDVVGAGAAAWAPADVGDAGGLRAGAGPVAVSLRPGGKPARLLLRLWAHHGQGERVWRATRCPARDRLEALKFVEVVGACLTLTLAGQQAARALEAGS